MDAVLQDRRANTRLFSAALQHIRDIQDPEHPYTLEQLNVVTADLVSVQDGVGGVQCVLLCMKSCLL